MYLKKKFAPRVADGSARPLTYPARAHEVEVTNQPASSSVTGLNKPHCAAGPAAIKANPVATQPHPARNCQAFGAFGRLQCHDQRRGRGRREPQEEAAMKAQPLLPAALKRRRGPRVAVLALVFCSLLVPFAFLFDRAPSSGM